MDDPVQAYLDAIPPEHRRMFDRMHHLVTEQFPDAGLVLSYQMPTFTVGAHRLHVGVWKHGLSLYGWGRGQDGGFAERHPELRTGKGTLQLRPAAFAALTDDELRELVRSVLGER